MEIRCVRRSAHLNGRLARGNAGGGGLLDVDCLLVVVDHDDEDDEGLPQDEWRGKLAESNEHADPPVQIPRAPRDPRTSSLYI